MRVVISIVLSCFFLSGCSSWSTSSVDSTAGAKPLATSTSGSASASTPKPAPAPKTDKKDIIVTDEDITDRKYESLGDISVTVNKTTLFHQDPTPALVREKLREEAAKLGADAVVLVRYGSVGISFFSWGSLDGKGRAVRFVE